MKKITFTLSLAMIFMIFNPMISFEKNHVHEYDLKIQTDMIKAQVPGDDFEIAIEEPDIGDSCAILCYAPGFGCEDWTGSGQGYEIRGKCSDLPGTGYE